MTLYLCPLSFCMLSPAATVLLINNPPLGEPYCTATAMHMIALRFHVIGIYARHHTVATASSHSSKGHSMDPQREATKA